MRRVRFDSVIPIRLPKRHKIALRRIARSEGSDPSSIVRDLIEQRIRDDEAARPAPGVRGSVADGADGTDDDLGAAA